VLCPADPAGQRFFPPSFSGLPSSVTFFSVTSISDPFLDAGFLARYQRQDLHILAHHLARSPKIYVLFAPSFYEKMLIVCSSQLQVFYRAAKQTFFSSA
jgi:hypothetical protein